MLPDEGIIRWLDRQARRSPLLTRSGDLHDLPEALGGRGAAVEPRENPIEVEGPPLSEEEYRDSVRSITADMRDRILFMTQGLGEERLGVFARKVKNLRRKALSGDLFGGFIRQNPPLPGARTSADRDYTEMRENPADKEMSRRSFRQLVLGVFDHLNDELQARTEALTKTERGYVVEKIKHARNALSTPRMNPDGEGTDSENEEEKPWWVDEGPENPDRFASRNKAEQRGVLLGCGEEYHEHDEEGETFFMPCATHQSWKKKTGRDNPSKNFHEASIRESDDGEYETYRREDNPGNFDRGIQILYGIRPEGEEGPRGGRSEIVSVFYPADAWNAANARRHAESTFEGFDSFDKATESRDNPSAENRTVSLKVSYDLEAGRRSHKEIIRWLRETVDKVGGEITWTDSRGPAGAPVSIEVGVEIFGVHEAATFQHRFKKYTEEELPGVASVHTTSLGMAEEIAGDSDMVVTVDVQYSSQDLPQVDPGDPPGEDRFYFDAKSIVKDTLGGWAVDVTELATPRTARFGFPTAREAIQAEAVLKDALEHYSSARVYLSTITDETTPETMHRANPQTSHAGGDSRLVRVTEQTGDLGQMESTPEVRSIVERATDAAGGEIVGVSEAPGGTVRDIYVEFDSPTGAEMFTNELNTTFFTRGFSDRALAVQEPPSRLAARQNPSSGGGAVLRVGVNTGALPDDAPDILSMVEDAAESEGADITGVRQSEDGGQKDYLVTADTTDKARAIINDLNNRFSTQGMGEAATATLQHEARENPPRLNPPAEIRVGINQDRIGEDAPDILSMVESAAEENDGEVSGVRQSDDKAIKDYTITAPTTAKARSIIEELSSKFTTQGMASATTVTLQHEARENTPGHTVRVEIPQSDTVYPEDASPSVLREKILETGRGMGGAVRQSSDGVIEVSFDSAENATSFQEAVVDDANDMGVSNVFVRRENPRPRLNPASTVLVRYPSGQSGLDSTVRDAAESAGGHVRSVGSAQGSKYSGMKEAEVRFNSQPGAFQGVGKIESSLRSEGIGEFEALTLAEEDVPPVRPNPLFPGGGESLLSISSEEPEGSGESALGLQDEPPEEEAAPTTLQSEAPKGSGGSALSIEAREAPNEVVAAAYRRGKAEGETDGLPDFNDEEEAFRHAVQTLPGTEVMEGIDTSTPDGLLALEEAASAWTNGYAEATGSNWPRLNPHAGEEGGDTPDPDTDATGTTTPRANPEGKKGGREALSYIGMTAAFLGGGVYLADSVLSERDENAPATAIVNE